jgi:hypothetical protein
MFGQLALAIFQLFCGQVPAQLEIQVTAAV